MSNSSLLFTLLLISVTLFSSCTPEGPTKMDRIAGTWKYDFIDYNGQRLGKEMLAGDPQITFNSDSSYSITLSGTTESGTWLVDNDTLITTAAVTGDKQVLTVERLSADSLTLAGDIDGIKIRFLMLAEKKEEVPAQ